MSVLSLLFPSTPHLLHPPHSPIPTATAVATLHVAESTCTCWRPHYFLHCVLSVSLTLTPCAVSPSFSSPGSHHPAFCRFPSQCGKRHANKPLESRHQKNPDLTGFSAVVGEKTRLTFGRVQPTKEREHDGNTTSLSLSLFRSLFLSISLSSE